jgi:hypothetical protein
MPHRVLRPGRTKARRNLGPFAASRLPYRLEAGAAEGMVVTDQG